MDGNDMVAVSAANKELRAFAKGIYATVFVQYSQGEKDHFCTGTIVGKHKDLLTILTNAHCLPESFYPQDGAVAADDCSKHISIYIHAAAGFEKNLQKLPCFTGSPKRDPTHDVAAFQVKGVVPPYIQPLAIKKKQLTIDRKAYLVHFSREMKFIANKFPRVSPGKHLARLPGAAITFTDCFVIPLAISLPTTQKTVLYKEFHDMHTCDSANGSNGAALIDANSHVILGLHWGGNYLDYFNHGRKYNLTIPSNLLVHFLKNHYFKGR